MTDNSAAVCETPAAPADGWRLVPEYPTDAMVDAFMTYGGRRPNEPDEMSHWSWRGDHGNFAAAYISLLSAAPAHPKAPADHAGLLRECRSYISGEAAHWQARGLLLDRIDAALAQSSGLASGEMDAHDKAVIQDLINLGYDQWDDVSLHEYVIKKIRQSLPSPQVRGREEGGGG